MEARVNRLRLGRPGMLGALLVAAGAAFLVFALQPLERRHEALLAQSEAAIKRKTRADSNVIPVSAAEGRLASFYAFFRRDGELLTDHLARLYALAGRAGVEARTAEYRLAESRGLRLVEYSISMPATGTYSEVRTFIEYALEEIPVLALDHVSLRRKRAADHQVEAEIRFTVFTSR
jgi:hypothetical protein